MAHRLLTSWTSLKSFYSMVVSMFARQKIIESEKTAFSKLHRWVCMLLRKWEWKSRKNKNIKTWTALNCAIFSPAERWMLLVPQISATLPINFSPSCDYWFEARSKEQPVLKTCRTQAEAKNSRAQLDREVDTARKQEGFRRYSKKSEKREFDLEWSVVKVVKREIVNVRQ